MVELEGVREKGAIASSRAAAIYGLDILAEGIQVRILSNPCCKFSKVLISFLSFNALVIFASLCTFPFVTTSTFCEMIEIDRQVVISGCNLCFVFALEFAIGLDSVICNGVYYKCS